MEVEKVPKSCEFFLKSRNIGGPDRTCVLVEVGAGSGFEEDPDDGISERTELSEGDDQRLGDVERLVVQTEIHLA